MIRTLSVLTLALLLPAGAAPAVDSSDAPAYTADGALQLPPNYREWVFLTSGLDMNYNTAAPVAGHSTFDNVFVNPSSYRAFLATGTWPDKTTFILELRSAEAHTNIDRRGQSQTTTVNAVEIHVKDEARIPGKWGFFVFSSAATASAAITPRPATCYTCHEAHGAVDTTFVQFYPTLIELARAKNTLSPEYLRDLASPSPDATPTTAPATKP